jgi:hypothetical protein
MKHNLSNVNDSGTNGLLVGCRNKWNRLLEIYSGTHGKFTKEMKGLEVGMTLGLNVWMLEPQKVPFFVEKIN